MSFNSPWNEGPHSGVPNDPVLPDDLAILGEELSASAAHLARVYPAPSYNASPANAPVELPRALPRSREWLFAGVAAAGVASVLVVASLVWHLNSVPGPQLPTTAHLTENSLTEVSPAHQAAAPARPAAAPEILQAWEVTPAAMFHELSAPELEGMLDLLEQQPPRELRLSI